MFYKINQNTQFIKWADHDYYRSKIVEDNVMKYSPLSPLKIIRYNCTINGASLEGRAQTVRDILDSNTKLPIPILPKRGLYMFPTTSTKNKDCIWFSYYQIKKYISEDKKALVFFQNNTSRKLQTSFNQFDTQFKRTSQVIAYYYRLTFLERKI